MTCKHDYHVVITESVTESVTDANKTTTTTRHTYDLYCQACGEKLPQVKAQ